MTGLAKRRFGVWLAAAVLAAAAWAAAAQAQQGQSQQGRAPQEKPKAEARSLRREMARDLFNITPEQEKKLQELREAGRKDRQAFHDEMLKMRGEMRELMKDSQANAAKIDKLIDSRARLRAEQEKRAFRSREEWRKVFTPEQLQKIDKYRGLFRERFAARQGRGTAGEGRGWRTGNGGRARGWRRPYDAWIWY